MQIGVIKLSIKTLITNDYQLHNHKQFGEELRIKRGNQVMDRVSSFIYNNKVHTHIIAGDFFHAPTPKFSIVNLAIKRLKVCLDQTPSEAIIFEGNHEFTSSDIDSPLAILGLAHPKITNIPVIYHSIRLQHGIAYSFILYCRKSELFLETLDRVVKNDFTGFKGKTLFLFCHQYFSCFNPFSGSDTIDVSALEAIANKLPCKLVIVSGHFHYQCSEIISEKLEIYHPGAIIDNRFDEAGYVSGGFEIDYDENSETLNYGLLNFDDLMEENKIGRFKILNFTRFMSGEMFDRTIKANADHHFYRFDISPLISSEHKEIIKKVVKENPDYHIKINWLTEKDMKEKSEYENKPIQWLSEREIIQMAVKELNIEKLNENKLIEDAVSCLGG